MYKFLPNTEYLSTLESSSERARLLLLSFVMLLACLAAAAVATATALPPGWREAIAQGSMLAFEPSSLDTPLDARLRPNIGNGYLATLAGSANVYVAGVFNLVGTVEPFRARFPGVVAMTPRVANGTEPPAPPRPACVAQPPEKRVRCGTPPYSPTKGCTASQGCCYGAFSPDPHSLPWCYAVINTSACANKCHVEVPAPKLPASAWADDEALDMANAAFLQTRTVKTAGSCAVTIEQRTYAHRTRLQLLVTDFILTMADTGDCTRATIDVKVAAGTGADPLAPGMQDFNWTAAARERPTAHAATAVFVGTTHAAEKLGRRVSAAFATAALLTGTRDLQAHRGKRTVYSFPTAFATDVDAMVPSDAQRSSTAEPVGGTAPGLVANASAELSAALAVGGDTLFAEHVAAVASERARARIEIVGNLALARVVNVTLYSLRASLSPEVAWSTAPGGLSTGGRWTVDGHDTHGGRGYPEGASSYYGHVFWDADVWMLPAMLPQHPAIARAMIGYRHRTMAAAVSNAHGERYNGAKWAWESAYSGVSATGGDCEEIHLQAGIAMAIRSYFRQTHDMAWLKKVAWPMLVNIVSFFESRVTIVGGGKQLSLDGVQSPNEYARGIDNDIYTNCAYASVLRWVGVAARLLRQPGAERYAALADRLIIPFNVTLNRHEEYSGAPDNLRIKQATVTMVPYPVGFAMPRAVQQNDLLYEAAHIGTEGPAMTHSMLAIDWLQMGNKTAGDAEFATSFATNLIGPYLQWMECPIPPDFCQNHRPATNFMTAAGGFVQAVLYGYLGLRYQDGNMTLLAPTLVQNTSAMAVRGVSYRGAILDVVWAEKTGTTITCVEQCTAGSGNGSILLCATEGGGGGGGAVEKLAVGVSARFDVGLTLVVFPCASLT